MHITSDKISPVHIQARDLEVRYSGVPALSCKQLDLKGRIISVIGHNGAGKSTLIKSMLDILPVSRGYIRAMQGEANKLTRLIPSKHMAFCPEEGSIFADISVESYISLWCKLKRQNAKYYRHEGSHYIERLDLAALLPKLGRELSKGERRRVQTAVGFFCQPRLFLLDEPFDGLDVKKAHELVNIIADESEKIAFIISSHRLDIIEWLSDTVVVLSRGKVAASGSPQDVSATLSKQTVSLDKAADNQQVINAVEEAFPHCFFRRLGETLLITGRDVSESRLLPVLASVPGADSIKVKSCPPGLIDAMNYHLQSGIDTEPSLILEN